ncbi:MAG: multidrug ABC transporter [Melioribacteraceae bacterium]|nr:MAG: multidrug ABC transporter [Melioribacteraceae bacterium]
MFLAKLSITRPVLTTMGILVFLIFGILAYLNINLNQMPDVEIPVVNITTIYPGAGPKEIETLITKRIEDVITTVSEIDYVESYSLDGASIIVMAFQLSKDVNIATQEVKDKVDAIINDLPDDAESPKVEKFDIRATPIMDLVLSGDRDPRELYEFADKKLKERFSQIQGVARVDINGGREREIRVEMDSRVVYENRISLPQLIQILQAQNMNIPGGYFQIDNQEFTVRLDGEFNDLNTISELQIPTAFGDKKVEQFAKVLDSGKDVRQRTTYFNRPTDRKDENVIQLSIVKSTEGNVVRIADAVRKAIPDIQKIIPSGVQLEIINDNADFTRATVDDTMSNIILGIIFTSIVLFIFLFNIRSTLIVALTMPVSIVSTFMLLQAAGLTLNIMTLMGLSVSVGVLVANSVVVLENIFRHKAMGADNKDAALKGTTEVTVAVIASTLTNLVVFLPIANMSSIVGMFMRELALAASFATIFSLIFSFTLTPMLASLILPKSGKRSKIAEKTDAFYKTWDEFYRTLLRISLKSKWINVTLVTLSIFVLIVVVGVFGPHLGFEFIPAQDDGKIQITAELPQGYNLHETAKVLETIESRVKTYPEVVHVITNLGKISDLNTGSNVAKMSIILVDANERERGIAEIIGEFVKELSDVPNAKIIVDRNQEQGAGGAPVQFYVLGQDVEVLDDLKDQIMDEIRDIPGLINLDQSSREGKPEITIYPDRVKLAQAGITTQELALTVRAAIEGIESSKYREDGEEYDITVTLTDVSVDSPEKVKNIPVVSSRDYSVYRLQQLADVEFTNGSTTILHRDKFTSIKFTGSNAPGYVVGDITTEIEKRISENINMPTGYQFSWGGNNEMMQEMINDMSFAFLLALVLTYILLAAILESFIQPMFILFTIPLALIGVIISLYVTNIALGITSMLAIIMLIGIVVNNAILMLDYTNQLVREEGMRVKDALIAACPTKLKPIIMSSLAIILGMLPMALGIGDAGKEMRMPLGVVSIGGLVVSTILTLFLIPALYNLIYDRKPKV